MKRNLVLFSIQFFLFSFCYGHPGIGIVKDSKGFIYYTDLKNVWKIDPKTMKQNIVVQNVHTHELYMDANDDLYGEHIWYNGEQLNTWGHYVWRLRNNGQLDSIVKPTEGFINDYSFVRDSSGNMYWVQRFTVSRFKKKSVDGTISTIAEGKFKDIRWMHATEDGTVYFIDLTDLYKINNNGNVVLLAKNLQERTSIFEYGSLKHNITGIWLDRETNIYIAVTGGQVVKKITPDGKVSNFVYSTGGWRPTGGLFDKEGNLWVLENKTNSARVRKVDKQTLTTSPPVITNIINKARPIVLLSTSLLIIILAIKRVTKKRRIKKSISFT